MTKVLPTGLALAVAISLSSCKQRGETSSLAAAEVNASTMLLLFHGKGDRGFTIHYSGTRGTFFNMLNDTASRDAFICYNGEIDNVCDVLGQIISNSGSDSFSQYYRDLALRSCQIEAGKVHPRISYKKFDVSLGVDEQAPPTRYYTKQINHCSKFGV